MFRLLALLQLTRAALAFTAIADAWAVLLLHDPGGAAAATTFAAPGSPQAFAITLGKMAVTAVVSFGLYAFGMSLNDLLDARRDRIFAPRRPIPSGRIPPRTAVVVSLTLLILALLAAAFLTPFRLALLPKLHTRDFIPWPLLVSAITAGLIVFYDAAAKYLASIGLITLGAIRAIHCLVGNPTTPVVFLSMFLFTHVLLVSALAYSLENKRPRLRKRDLFAIGAAVVIGNGLALFYMHLRHALTAEMLPMLAGPAVAAALYAAWTAFVLTRKALTARQKGERIMLLGLFWLFAYDASILLANHQPLASLAITLLLLCAIGSFFGIRLLSRAMANPKLAYRPDTLTSPLAVTSDPSSPPPAVSPSPRSASPRA